MNNVVVNIVLSAVFFVFGIMLGHYLWINNPLQIVSSDSPIVGCTGDESLIVCVRADGQKIILGNLNKK